MKKRAGAIEISKCVPQVDVSLFQSLARSICLYFFVFLYKEVNVKAFFVRQQERCSSVSLRLTRGSICEPGLSGL